MWLFKKLKPNKRRVLIFLLLFLIIPTYFLVYLLLGGSAWTTDRGHESYNASKASETYLDTSEPVMTVITSILGLPYAIDKFFYIDLLESGFNYKLGIVIEITYLYIIGCLLDSLFTQLQRKPHKPEKHEL